MRSTFAGALALFVRLAALLLAVGPAAAEDTSNPTYRLDIPRQPAIEALKEFGRQTGRRIISVTDPSLDLGPLKGQYTAKTALEKLLAPAGLTFDLMDDAFVIRPPSAPGTRAPARPRPSARTAAAPSALSVVVLGRRPQPQPSLASTPNAIVLDEKHIALDSPSQVSGLLRSLSQQPFAVTRRPDGAQFAEFRGLGIDTTTVMINGRRAPPTLSETSGNFDLSLVPITAVSAVEVALEPTSVAFGPPASGGLLNIELKRNIVQPTVELQYGGAAGGATERRLAMATGFDRNRLSGNIVVEHFERDLLLGAMRSLWRDQDYRRFGGIDYRVTASTPGNIRSVNGQNLPGLSSPIAAVPIDTGDFESTAGAVNFESLNRYNSVMPAMSRSSLVASADVDLTPFTQAFGELLYTHHDVTQRFSPPVVSQILPLSNPYNPFGTPVLVDVLLSELAPRQLDTQGDLLRSVAGLKGQLRSSWHWELAAVSTQENLRVISSNELDQQRLAEALAEADPSRALNVFDPTSPANRALLEQLIAPPTVSHFESNTTTVTGTVHGEFQIARRPMSISVGSEWEDAHAVASAKGPLRRTVASTFAELGIPLSRATMLSLGSRFDRVSDVGDLFSPQLAIEWRPFNALRLHASTGKSVRAASLANLYQPTRRLQTVAFDPSRQQVSKLDVLVGGNDALEPVTARTFAAGFSLEPESSRFSRVEAKYWRITLEDRIIVPAVSFLLEHEELFPGRVMRSVATEADRAAGQPGSLQLIDTTRINGGRLDTSGVDLGTSLAFDTLPGLVTAGLDVTYVDEYASAEPPGLLQVERAGVASPYGTIPKWRAVASVTLERSFGTVATTLRHVPAYRDAYIEPTGRMIPSQTLLDLKVVIDLGQVFGRPTMLDGLKLALGVENIFDTAPDFAEVGQAAGFDPSQGDLRQRFMFVKVAHRL